MDAFVRVFRLIIDNKNRVVVANVDSDEKGRLLFDIESIRNVKQLLQ